MANAQDRGWGPPCDVPKVTIVRSDGLRLPVHRAIADLVRILLDLTEMMGYDVPHDATWGGLCRKISGTSVWSNHAWWLAVDIDPPHNPYASAEWHRRNARGTRPFDLAIVCNIPERVIRLWEDHGFYFGGRYKTKPDPMHMEFMGTPADARRHTERIKQYLADHGGPVAPLPLPPEEPDMDADDKARALKIERMLEGLPRNGMLDYGGRGGDLNDYRILPDGSLVQIVAAGGPPSGRFLTPEDTYLVGSLHGPFVTDTPNGPNTRVDFTVLMPSGRLRWFTFDPSRPGFPTAKPEGASGVTPSGFHYVDVG